MKKKPGRLTYEAVLRRFRVLLAQQGRLGALIDEQMRLLKQLREDYKE